MNWLRHIRKIRNSHTHAAKYPYLLDPIQLSALVGAIDELADKPGCIVEIGVYRGWSTMFLCEHIQVTYPDKPPAYYAIDTFSSFVDDHLDYEVAKRSKVRKKLGHFFYNDYEIWTANFRKYPFVNAIKADCTQFDFSRLGPIKLALIDVDIYVPTFQALSKVYPCLIEGGVILVDDVIKKLDTAYAYDGAREAYLDFCSAHHLPPTYIGRRCGLIRR